MVPNEILNQHLQYLWKIFKIENFRGILNLTLYPFFSLNFNFLFYVKECLLSAKADQKMPNFLHKNSEQSVYFLRKTNILPCFTLFMSARLKFQPNLRKITEKYIFFNNKISIYSLLSFLNMNFLSHLNKYKMCLHLSNWKALVTMLHNQVFSCKMGGWGWLFCNFCMGRPTLVPIKSYSLLIGSKTGNWRQDKYMFFHLMYFNTPLHPLFGPVAKISYTFPLKFKLTREIGIHC